MERAEGQGLQGMFYKRISVNLCSHHRHFPFFFVNNIAINDLCIFPSPPFNSVTPGHFFSSFLQQIHRKKQITNIHTSDNRNTSTRLPIERSPHRQIPDGKK